VVALISYYFRQVLLDLESFIFSYFIIPFFTQEEIMLQVNTKQARFNMVEQQIRPWDVLNQQVLDLISELPRENFVPTAYRNLAFADINIPLAHDQEMMSPKLEGRMVQTLQLTPKDSVLEIGTGSGYLTALLAKSAKHVDSVDIYEDFVIEANKKLKALNINNISIKTGDGINGWNLDTRYDVIVLTGSVGLLQSHFQEQLNEGGRLLAIVGNEPIMQAHLITRIDGNFYTENLFDTLLPPLLGTHVENFVL
jgi:protein-L-isoaspartate(D-aspartate) O-methyltransferase